MTDFRPGIITDMTLAEYHADPCPEPSCSAGLAWTLLTQTPLHAATEHPRLNLAWQPADEGIESEDEPDEKRKKHIEKGQAYHADILGQQHELVILEPADYPNKNGSIPKRENDAMKAARKAAKEAGKIPVSLEVAQLAAKMADKTREQLRTHEIGPIFERPGGAEQSFFWQEPNGVWCRCRPDWVPIASDDLGPLYIYSLKTTTNAHPNVFRNRIEQLGYAFKAAWYIRGVQAVTGYHDVRYRWIVVEVEPPHALAVYEPDEADLYGGIDETTGQETVGADALVEDAIRIWGDCLNAGRWPGYPPKVMTLGCKRFHREQQSMKHSQELSPEAIQQAISWAKQGLAA